MSATKLEVIPRLGGLKGVGEVYQARVKEHTDWVTWEVTTNGCAIAARRHEGNFDLPRLPEVVDGVVELLAPLPHDYHVDFAILSASVGEPEAEVSHPCACPCGSAAHAIVIPPPSRYARLAGVAINANLLAHALATLGIEGERAVWVGTFMNGNGVAIDGDGWRIRLAGLDPNLLSAIEIPSLDVQPPQSLGASHVRGVDRAACA